jgi:hypothetical protein
MKRLEFTAQICLTEVIDLNVEYVLELFENSNLPLIDLI